MSAPNKPITRQRSTWEPIPHPNLTQLEAAGAKSVGCWRRNVSDGFLLVIIANEPDGWHLSISFRDHRGNLSRYPRWDEITDAHYGIAAIPEDVTMCMVLPPPAEYVAVHDTTFHLHEMEARS